MPISLSCACSARYQVKDAYAGRRTKCRQCGEPLVVPKPDEPLDVIPVEDEPILLAEVVEAPGVRREQEPVVMIDDDAEDDARMRRKQKRKKAAPAKAGGWFAFEKNMASKGIAGGLLMMILAVVWFVGALVYMDRIFFYPPVLFVIGIISFVKGLTDR